MCESATAETGAAKNQAVFEHNQIVSILSDIRMRVVILLAVKLLNAQDNLLLYSMLKE